nr:DKNYY domain-containing protein [Rhodoferax sp.]
MKKYPLWILITWVISLLFGCSDSNYHKKGGKWHYDGVPVDSVNEPVNFVVIDRYFAKDDQNGFYQGRRIYTGSEPSDGTSFEVLNSWYAKDKHRVYYCDTERDAKEYWSIKRIVIKIVNMADPASFRMMSDGYTPRDNFHLFDGVKTVPIRDINTYGLLVHSFSKDKASAYYKSIEIAGSDSSTFVVLDAHYAKDKFKVYFVDGFFLGGFIKNVHIESFKALDDGYASDENRGYYKGVVITKTDTQSLVYLNRGGYAKSEGQVFYNGQLMPDTDAASFNPVDKFDPEFDASDKTGLFRSGVRVKAAP